MDTIDLSRFFLGRSDRDYYGGAWFGSAFPPDSQRPAPTLSLRLCRPDSVLLWSIKYNVLRDRSRVSDRRFECRAGKVHGGPDSFQSLAVWISLVKRGRRFL